MNVVRIHRRANADSRGGQIARQAVKAEMRRQLLRTRDGRVRRLAVQRCGTCGRLFYGTRQRFLTAKQQAVNHLCPNHFRAKYGKNRPPPMRFLSRPEIEALNRYYEATGVKVFRIDSPESETDSAQRAAATTCG